MVSRWLLQLYSPHPHMTTSKVKCWGRKILPRSPQQISPELDHTPTLNPSVKSCSKLGHQTRGELVAGVIRLQVLQFWTLHQRSCFRAASCSCADCDQYKGPRPKEVGRDQNPAQLCSLSHDPIAELLLPEEGSIFFFRRATFWYSQRRLRLAKPWTTHRKVLLSNTSGDSIWATWSPV